MLVYVIKYNPTAVNESLLFHKVFVVTPLDHIVIHCCKWRGNSICTLIVYHKVLRTNQRESDV